MFEDLFEAKEKAKRTLIHNNVLNIWKEVLEEVDKLSTGRYLSQDEIIKNLSQKYNLTKST